MSACRCGRRIGDKSKTGLCSGCRGEASRARRRQHLRAFYLDKLRELRNDMQRNIAALDGVVRLLTDDALEADTLDTLDTRPRSGTLAAVFAAEDRHNGEEAREAISAR